MRSQSKRSARGVYSAWRERDAERRATAGEAPAADVEPVSTLSDNPTTGATTGGGMGAGAGTKGAKKTAAKKAKKGKG
jgi:hypothetical protein